MLEALEHDPVVIVPIGRGDQAGQVLPPASELVVTLRAAGATVIESDAVAVCAGLEESVTLAVKLYVPDALGVPEICPPVARLNPVGNCPVAIDQL